MTPSDSPVTAPAPTVPTAEEAPPLSPLERLARSRAQMREWLVDGGRNRRSTTLGDAARSAPVRKWLQGVRQQPVIGTVVDAVMGWWLNHPAHAVAVVAGAAARDAAVPLARRHPWLLILASLLAGAAVVRLKPWRLLFSSALFAGLATQVASRLVAQVPVESVIASVMRLVSRNNSRAARGRAAQPGATGPSDTAAAATEPPPGGMRPTAAGPGPAAQAT